VSGEETASAFAVVAAEAIRVRVPFRRPIRTAAGEWTHRESWILRLFDAAGGVGVGEAALDFDAAEGAVEAELARLIGELVERLCAGGRLPRGDELQAAGVPGRALTCALSSVYASLHRGLRSRGFAGPVPVNATIGYLELAEAEAAAREAVAAGFGTIKMKVGPERDTGELVERVAVVRMAAGPDVRLRLDVNGAWGVVTARERIAAVAPYGIEYVEQPVAAGDPRSLAAVREASPVPIGADESVCCVKAARELVEAWAADVLVVKLARVGGRTAAVLIAALAAANGVPVVISTLFETGVGISAALGAVAAVGVPDGVPPSFAELAHGLATAHLLESDLLTQPLRVADGRMVVPVDIALDELALRHYAVEWHGRRP